MGLCRYLTSAVNLTRLRVSAIRARNSPFAHFRFAFPFLLTRLNPFKSKAMRLWQPIR